MVKLFAAASFGVQRGLELCDLCDEQASPSIHASQPEPPDRFTISSLHNPPYDSACMRYAHFGAKRKRFSASTITFEDNAHLVEKC